MRTRCRLQRLRFIYVCLRFIQCDFVNVRISRYQRIPSRHVRSQEFVQYKLTFAANSRNRHQGCSNTPAAYRPGEPQIDVAVCMGVR